MFVSKNCLFKSTLFCIPTATKTTAGPNCEFLTFQRVFYKAGFFLVQKQKRKKPTVRLLYFKEILNETQDPPRQENDPDGPSTSKKGRRAGVRPPPVSTLVLGLEMTALHSV